MGGGDSAVESALLLAEQNEVCISYRKENFSRIKPKNRQKITNALENGGLKAYFNSNVTRIEADKIVLQLDEADGKDVELENDLVYIFIGGELPTDFLQNAGIAIAKKFGQIVKSH